MKCQDLSKKDFDAHFVRMTLDLDDNLLEKCEEDPIFFSKYMLGVDLYAWQVKVVDSIVKGRKRVAVNTSRQIGKSSLVGIIALWCLVFNKGNSGLDCNTKVGIVSRGDEQAKKVLLMIKNFIRLGDAHMSKVGKGFPKYFSDMIDSGQTAENNKTTLTFKSGVGGSKVGSFVKSLPPTDAVRGWTFDVVIEDEASRIEDEIHTTGIMPTGDNGFFNGKGALRLLTSTPYGNSGHYYEIFDPDEKREVHGWERFWFTIDAIRFDEPERYEAKLKELEEERVKGNEMEVEQEYYGSFVASESNFFSADVVDACMTGVKASGGRVDLGVDFGGQTTSKTVVTVTRLAGDVIERIGCLSYEVGKDESLISDLERLRKEYVVGRVVCDDCAAGDFLIRSMESLGWQVTRFNFKSEKIDKYHAFRAKLNLGKVKSYFDDDLIKEMKALKLVEGKVSHRIRAPRGYGDDFIDSFLISSYHFLVEEGGFGSYSVDFVEEKRESRDARFDDGLSKFGKISFKNVGRGF